jgi:hypothetical protein
MPWARTLGFDRKRGLDDGSDTRFVDPHAESDGREITFSLPLRNPSCTRRRPDIGLIRPPRSH